MPWLFAMSVSASGIPGMASGILQVPITVPMTALVRQAIGLATGDRTRLDYELTGRLAGPGFGGVGFRSTGELSLPVRS